jgi:hypothetical protein
MSPEVFRERVSLLPIDTLKAMIGWNNGATLVVADPEFVAARNVKVEQRKKKASDTIKAPFLETAGPEFAPLAERLEFAIRRSTTDIDSDDESVSSVKSDVSHTQRVIITLRIKLDGVLGAVCSEEYLVDVSRHKYPTQCAHNGSYERGRKEVVEFPEGDGIPSTDAWNAAIAAFFVNYTPVEVGPPLKKRRAANPFAE